MPPSDVLGHSPSSGKAFGFRRDLSYCFKENVRDFDKRAAEALIACDYSLNQCGG